MGNALANYAENFKRRGFDNSIFDVDEKRLEPG